MLPPPNPHAAKYFSSQRNSPAGDASKFFRDAREVDDIDRVERRRLLELFMDQRQRLPRDRTRSLDADIDVGSFVRGPLGARSEQKDAIGRVGHMPSHDRGRETRGLTGTMQRFHGGDYTPNRCESASAAP